MQQQQGTKTRGTFSSAEIQLRETISQWEEAFRSGDVKKILTFYADDVVAFDMVAPLQFDGKANYKRSWEEASQMAQAPWIYEALNRKVEVNAKLAFAHCLAKCGGEIDGKTDSGWVRHTQCFKKIGDRWLIVHEALSVPIDMKNKNALMGLTPESLKH